MVNRPGRGRAGAKGSGRSRPQRSSAPSARRATAKKPSRSDGAAAASKPTKAPSRPGVPPEKLTNQQARYLKGLAHSIKPLALIGKEGVTEGFVTGLQQELVRHELVKVRLLRSCPLDKHEAAEVVPAKAGAVLVQLIGKTLLLYAPHPTDPVIRLPKAPADATAESEE